MFVFRHSFDDYSQHYSQPNQNIIRRNAITLHSFSTLIVVFVIQSILNYKLMSTDIHWRKTWDMSSILMTTRGQLTILLAFLALTSCMREVLSSPRCVALCHRSEMDSLCKRCRFREPMRFGKRSDEQAFRVPMRFGKRLENFDDFNNGFNDYKRSVALNPKLLRLLMSNNINHNFE